MRVDVRRIGHEGEPIVVVDDAVADPEALVDAACMARLAPAGEYYPGPRAPVPSFYLDAIAPIAAAAVRNVFGHAEHLSVDRALFSLVTTPPDRLALAQRVPHVDSTERGRIAIVHYLAHQDFGGTGFFRHRSTGYETITPDRHRRYLDALAADFATHGEPPPGYINGDTPLFDAIATIEPEWNRAILYRSHLLHCAAIPPGIALPRDPRTGRLTIASFLSAR